MSEHNPDSDQTKSHVVISPGTKIQHYRIVEKIGAGGMGEVYLAEDTKLSRRVALKFLPSHLIANQTIRVRFVREAQTIAKLNHPNIVSVYDVSEFEGRPFYVMELVEGESLHYYCHEKPLPMDLIIDYAIQICQGLGEAHRAGIIHRDIKSANLALDKNGRIRLLDFGLAAREGDDKITKTGSTLGTVSYMSPEQVSGRDIDHRSDLFSLGIVLYELIAGRTPFKRDNEGATLKAIMEDTPEPLTRFKSDVPAKLQEIVMELLEKDKELRYQSAEGVIADLKRLVYDSQPTGRVGAVRPQSRKRGLYIGAAAALFVVAVIAGWRMLVPADVTLMKDEGRVPMIAVLPFDNLGASEDEYFAEGITDEITSRLAKINGLGVISRASAMKYKGSDKPLNVIGQELGVDYVIEGTVRWSKVGKTPRVRITPELVSVTDGRHLWGDNYERELLEVFAIQADIATQIVDQLGLTLVQKDNKVLDARPTNNPEAYALYLKALSLIGRYSLNTHDVPAMEASIDSAVTLDPDFALAHALRSRVYSWSAFGIPHSDDARRAREAADRALQLDPDLPQGHIALGTYYNLVERQYDRALEEFNRAKSETHNDPDLLDAIALVQMRQGRFQESAENFAQAAELDPLSPNRHRSSALPLYYMRSFKEASNALDRAIALDPSTTDFWEYKLTVLNSWHGDRNVLKEVALEALQHCDSVKFLSGQFSLMEQLPEVQWENTMWAFRDNFRGWQPEDYYSRLALMNYYLGDSVQMRAYTDSLRIALEKILTDNPDDWESVSIMGAAFAVLGDCERAVEYGRKGLDSLSVDKCHW